MSDYRLTDEELSDLIDSPTINLFQRAYLTELRDARKALAERDAEIVGLKSRLDIAGMLRADVKHAADCECAVCTGCIT